MDRTQHQRYLFYLQRYVYFGRGIVRLDAVSFAAAEEELKKIGRPTDDDAKERRRELTRQLLRD